MSLKNIIEVLIPGVRCDDKAEFPAEGVLTESQQVPDDFAVLWPQLILALIIDDVSPKYGGESQTPCVSCDDGCHDCGLFLL